MSVASHAELAFHVGHHITCVSYADGENVALECEDCGTVLVDYDRPSPEPPAAPAPRRRTISRGNFWSTFRPGT